MTEYVLSFKPSVGQYGWHDPSAVLFEDGDPVFGIEEERHSREKHAPHTFPTESIRECLDVGGITLSQVDRILLPYIPELRLKIASHLFKRALTAGSIYDKLYHTAGTVTDLAVSKFFPMEEVKRTLEAEFETPLPPLEHRGHHACHAASAFHPSGFEDAVVLTLDARGEYDASVVWRGTADGLERIRTYPLPNSLGYLFGAVTEFLGYHANNGEGKIMGLAPYGEHNDAILEPLRSHLDTSANYDVTGLVDGTIDGTVENLEELFGRDRRHSTGEFSQWEKDLAAAAQRILEEIVVNMVERYCREFGTGNVALAGGVALNCKVNKRVMEADGVDDVFIQPVAHDGGLALGAGLLDQRPADVAEMTDVYLGSGFGNETIVDLLETNKIDYREPDDLEAEIADAIADGALVGWFQGRMEMGPRALGNRSILADPRTEESRDRVNKFVKHREEWRPFAPSMTEAGADEYLENAGSAPFMIKTFDVVTEKADEIEAVLHPADETTRPQTVRPDQNERYHRLLTEFEDRTGVPVLLNTSFNDHAEPIVRTPAEALKDFYGMGLDILVLNDFVIEK
jgi:carbamoyltransferase